MIDYAPPKDLPPRLLFGDGDLIAVDKPSGLLSVPGRGDDLRDCVESRCREQFPTARIVHRLDLETSGVMVLALTADSHRELSRLFRERRMEKTYLAWVAGEMTAAGGEIDLPLIRDWPNRPRQKVDLDTGKPALTRWRLLETRDGASLLSLTPVTGRSHQLRVHLKEIGHPILGDGLYAPPEIAAAAPRLQLHAARLSFTHPVTGEHLTLEAPFPLTGAEPA